MQHPLQLELKSLLIKNAKEVLQRLLQVFVNNRQSYNEVVNLASRLDRIIRTKSLEGMKEDELNFQISQINNGILYLIDQISEEEIAAYELEQGIFQKILVVCKSTDRKEEMEKLFPRSVFRESKIEDSGIPLPIATVNSFDLIVFDNTPHGEQNDPQELLLYYLTQTEPYLLYYGKPLPLLYQYPDKAYFANSQFSVHARLEEMITYLKFSNKPEK